eukprot:10800712-Heterocapsa_arctica.AAC.1
MKAESVRNRIGVRSPARPRLNLSRSRSSPRPLPNNWRTPTRSLEPVLIPYVALFRGGCIRSAAY